MLEHGACYTPYVLEHHEYYRLFTCMFLHFGIQHLIGNMLVLIFLGDTLEQTVGKIRYLIIYILGGLAGNLLSMYHSIQTQDFAVSAGASGAIFAVVGALIYIVAVNLSLIHISLSLCLLHISKSLYSPHFIAQ